MYGVYMYMLYRGSKNKILLFPYPYLYHSGQHVSLNVTMPFARVARGGGADFCIPWQLDAKQRHRQPCASHCQPRLHVHDVALK